MFALWSWICAVFNIYSPFHYIVCILHRDSRTMGFSIFIDLSTLFSDLKFFLSHSTASRFSFVLNSTITPLQSVWYLSRSAKVTVCPVRDSNDDMVCFRTGPLVCLGMFLISIRHLRWYLALLVAESSTAMRRFPRELHFTLSCWLLLVAAG